MLIASQQRIVDLRYGDLRIEVKASGLSQSWNPSEPVDAELRDCSPQDGLGRGYRRVGEFRSAQAGC